MSAGTTKPTARPGTQRRRAGLLALAVALAAADLVVKAWAQRALPDGPIEGGPLDLKLGFNTGTAFSFGAEAPAWTIVAVTGLITALVAGFLWRSAPKASRGWGVALAAVLGGAAANLIDRAPDGKVTDYLHTGWWPTFNLADVFIVGGGLLMVLLSSLTDRHDGVAQEGRIDPGA